MATTPKSKLSRGRPAKRYSQAERVLRLYDRLHRGEALRASAVSRDLGVDRRTLQRDLRVLADVLDARGTPLERVSDPVPGLRLPGDAKRWSATRWQLLAIALGARLSGFLSGERFATQVAPLLAQLRDSLRSSHALEVHELQRKLHVVETGQKLYRRSDEDQRRLAALLDALLLDLPVSLAYRSPANAGALTRLRVHALCMTVHRGAVYFVVEVLSGDRHAGERILLALDRVADVVLDQSAKRRKPPAFDAEAFFVSAFGVWTGRGRYRVDLRIAPSYAWAVQERTWHATQVLSVRPDGSLRLRMQLGELREIADWVLGMGEHCKVEGPAELRKLVTTRLQKALLQYESDAGATYSVARTDHATSQRRSSKPPRRQST